MNSVSTAYFLSFAWGIVILLALIGWGGILNCVLFSRHRIDWGQRAAWGLALSVIIGGLLNFTWSISRLTVLLYLSLGTLYWLIDTVSRGWRSSLTVAGWIGQVRAGPIGCIRAGSVALGALIVIVLSLFYYASTVSIAENTYLSLNRHDDFHAYIVFPQKMLQTGALGRDPFSERRMTSALGGQSFLHTFVLSMRAIHNLHLLDPGLGLVMVVGLLTGYFRQRRSPPALAFLLILFFFTLPVIVVNITSVTLGQVLLLSLFRTLDWQTLSAYPLFSRTFLIALLAAAICTLKSSFIPACAILFICSYVFYVVGSPWAERRTALIEFVVSTCFVGLFLLPWMLSMLDSSGTLLYPVFGRGYHGSVYGEYLAPYAFVNEGDSVGYRAGKALSWNLFLRLVILLGILHFMSRRWKIDGREAVLSLVLGVVLGVMVLAFLAVAAFRQTFPLVSVALLVLIAEALAGHRHAEESVHDRADQPRRRGRLLQWSYALIAVFVAGFVVWIVWPTTRIRGGTDAIRRIQIGVQTPSLIAQPQLRQHRSLQRAIPAGDTLLARLEMPFLLDFRRNTIFIVDWPGAASPPPGMPLSGGSEELAGYLLSQSIRYVAYSYANEAGFSQQLASRRLKARHAWVRTHAKHTVAFHERLSELGATRKRIYDDGEMFVLDLRHKTSDALD